MMREKSKRQKAGRTITGIAAHLAFLLTLIGGVSGVSVGALLGPVGTAHAATGISEEVKIRHLLQRATFGYTSEEAARVRQMGRNEWLWEQVRPEPIDDPELQERLSLYPSLSMGAGELLQNYPKVN